MTVGYNMGLEPSGRELLVVVAKGTFRIPSADESPEAFALQDEQVPLVMVDTFTGQPGFSAPVYEADFAAHKGHCDLLLLGSAYAPDGYSATTVDVGFQVGRWRKTMCVLGSRHWEFGLAGLRASAPEPFTVQSISYDVAFGGTDFRHEHFGEHAAYMANPVGKGFHKHLRREWLDGTSMPSTQETGRPVSDPRGNYRPMAFGPVGRAWHPRSSFAGTYDSRWREEHFPFAPPDFDTRYYQAAPTDQQLSFDQVGEGPLDVVLTGLTPGGTQRFRVPHLVAPVYIFPKRGSRENLTATLDTLVVEPDRRRFTMTWRCVRPLAKSLHELAQVLVGRKGREWWQARESLAFPIPIKAVR